ncbi:Hypothetical predicted protein [Olea europaea subsp. europaea]|uniref:Uncharacterized protein n=1 Tax=Olea europaea subsp. europaea TaxID=158383 RepID=A0A8S0UCZ4_OLEEU|nr:Hypothetical predicted protein [Olea europaea subsp. europaea]
MQNSKFKPIQSKKPTSLLKTTMLMLENPVVDPGDSSRTVDLSEDTLVIGVDELRKNCFWRRNLIMTVLKKKRVSKEDWKLEWNGETEPATVESEGDNSVNDTDVIFMETEEIGEKLTTINLGEDSVEKMCKENVVVGENANVQKTGET